MTIEYYFTVQMMHFEGCILELQIGAIALLTGLCELARALLGERCELLLELRDRVARFRPALLNGPVSNCGKWENFTVQIKKFINPMFDFVMNISRRNSKAEQRTATGLPASRVAPRALRHAA